MLRNLAVDSALAAGTFPYILPTNHLAERNLAFLSVVFVTRTEPAHCEQDWIPLLSSRSMTNSSLLFRFMYLATAILAAANAIVVFRRKLYRDVPWFTIYLVFTSLGMLVDEVLWENQANFPDNLYVFFFVGWFITGCILTLATMFVLEGWRNLLNEYPAIRRLGLIVLGIVAVVLLALALASVPYGQSDSNRFGMYAMKIAFVAERSVRFVLVGLIAAFFMF